MVREIIPKYIRREHILEALKKIDEEGIPPKRQSRKYYLVYNGKYYPPKYVVSIANAIATGEELDPKVFNGGRETNIFLKKLGFKVVQFSP